MLITNLTWVFYPTFGRSCVVYRCATFWVYEIQGDIAYVSCRSRRELPEYTKITLLGKKALIALIWVQKSCFFCTKKALRAIENRNHTYVYIQLVNDYQNHHHMTIHYLPFVKKLRVKKFIFSDFRYFKGITGAICNGIKR
jgi:hypothetical protein